MKINKSSSWSICIFYLFVSISLGGCVTAMQKKVDTGMDPLGSAELQTLFSKPFEADFVSSESGRTFMVKYFPDGSQMIEYGGKNDDGSWRITDGKHCSRWESTRNGAERCSYWFKLAEGRYELFNTSESKIGLVNVR